MRWRVGLERKWHPWSAEWSDRFIADGRRGSRVLPLPPRDGLESASQHSGQVDEEQVEMGAKLVEAKRSRR